MPIQNDRRPTVSIGWELEATRAPSRVPDGVVETRDGSVHGEAREYKTAGNLITVLDRNLQALYNLATDTRLTVDPSCGFHVHVGLPDTSYTYKRQWSLFFYELGRRVQERAFEAVPRSRRNNHYCMALQPVNTAVGYYDTLQPPNRYQWVNISNLFITGEIETVEIRLLGSTKRINYLLSWVAVSVAMGHAAYRLMYDPTRFEIETENMRNRFDWIASHVGPNAIDGNGWNDVEGILRDVGLPVPRRTIITNGQTIVPPVQPQATRTVPITINGRPATATVPVRRRRTAVPVAPIEITEEMIRRAREQFTVAPVGA